MRRYGMRDDQWERIQDLLPGRVGHVGVTAKDNRLFVEAVLYRYRTGIPWRDLPERFGCGVKVQTRFSRWAKAGVWERVFQYVFRAEQNQATGRRKFRPLRRPMVEALARRKLRGEKPLRSLW